eukprot:15364395-Ditylum_brightwellii.AAC.2
METSALAVYALQSHAHISQELMLRVAPHVNNHGFKFLPINLPYDKSIRDRKQNFGQLLKKQNQYLSKYEDFRISGVNKELFEEEIGNITLRGKLELAGVMGDITPTVFTKLKGIWQVGTTKIQVVEAMRHVTEGLENICNKISECYKVLYSAFPYPRVLNTSCVPVQYAKSLISNVEILENNNSCDKLPPSAWINGLSRKQENQNTSKNPVSKKDTNDSNNMVKIRTTYKKTTRSDICSKNLEK